MPDEIKVTVAPDQIPEATAEAPLIENRRAEIEKQVAAETKEIFEAPVPLDDEVPEKVEEPKKESAPEETSEELDRIEQIKKSTQKRIDKVIAKQKTAEEKLAEAQAEIERLKAAPKPPEISTPKDNTPPTPEQVEAYIAKMSEEGNHKEVAAATRYLIKLEKEIAMKEVQEMQTRTQTETHRQNEEMKALANDYVELDENGKPDITSDMTLANQKGLLFQLAMDYWNDPVKHRDRYNNPNIVEGFRRSVADAYRDIQEHNKIAPKGETPVETRRPTRQALAEPEAETNDEPAISTAKDSLSDADKVREEIKNRTKNRYIRR